MACYVPKTNQNKQSLYIKTKCQERSRVCDKGRNFNELFLIFRSLQQFQALIEVSKLSTTDEYNKYGQRKVTGSLAARFDR